MDIILAVIFILGVAADRLSKIAAVNSLMGTGGKVIIDRVLRFSYVENAGAAFGVLGNMRWLLVGISVAALAAVAYLLFAKRITHPLGKAALVLLAAGSLGNLIDRLFYGKVVDFIDLMFVNFAVFNLADCFITVSAVLLVIYIIFYAKDDNFAKA